MEVDPDAVVPTVAAVLGLQAAGGRSVAEVLFEAIAARHLLVVLDNCEHLIDAVASLAARLVSASGRSRLLATSREGLAVPGEKVVPVPPMALATLDDDPALALACDAVRLFVERAAEARDGFEPDSSEVATIARLCRRLDGIPLAIELAAARVRSMAPADILSHLDQRFRLLSTGRRTSPTRQQTLRGAVDWSYGLLEERERMLLRRLSVFVGGLGLEAAAAVVTDELLARFDVVDLLDRLVDKSLVVAEIASGTTRYRLLDTIRDYGLERLDEAGEAATVALRHAEHYASFAAEAGVGLRGPDEARWDRLVEAELENLRAALAWAVSAGEADVALRIVAGLAIVGHRMGMPFGRAAAEAAGLEWRSRPPAPCLGGDLGRPGRVRTG